jgi:hypothetical protein
MSFFLLQEAGARGRKDVLIHSPQIFGCVLARVAIIVAIVGIVWFGMFPSVPKIDGPANNQDPSQQSYTGVWRIVGWCAKKLRKWHNRQGCKHRYENYKYEYATSFQTQILYVHLLTPFSFIPTTDLLSSGPIFNI